MRYLILICGISAVLGRPSYDDDDDYSSVYNGPPAPIGRDGRVVDTPEVARAKAAHLSAHSKVAYDGSSEEDSRSASYEEESHAPYAPSAPSQFSNRVHHYIDHPVYTGPAAPLNHEGRVVDTPEVQQEKAKHFALFHKEALRNQAAPILYYAGHGPYTNSGPAPLAHDGRVVDTPEVAHAKAAHLAAHAKALSQAHVPYYNNYY